MAKNECQRTPERKKTDQRRRELAAIHIGAKQLGMDNDTYREMLFDVAGVKSSADLDAAGRKKVLAHLWECGFRPAVKSARGSKAYARPAKERAPYIFKIGRLLEALELPWAYADGIAAKMFGVRFVRWLNPDQLHKLLIALVYHQKRKG